MTSKRYFVTGGAGFIGSHFVNSILDGGHSGTCSNLVCVSRRRE